MRKLCGIGSRPIYAASSRRRRARARVAGRGRRGPACPRRAGPWRRRGSTTWLHRAPLERADREQVRERHEQHEQEDAHHDEPVRRRGSRNTVENGIEEDDLDVEDDERHRDQVELHREALGRLVLGHDAALVRRLLRRRRALAAPSSCRRDERERARRARRARSSRGSAGSRSRPATPSSCSRSRRDRRCRAQAIRTVPDDACSSAVAIGQTSSSAFTRSKRARRRAS